MAVNVALVLLSTVIAVLIAEMAVRIAGFRSMYAGTQFFQYDPTLGWRLLPNLEGPFERPQFRTYVKINQLGLRDRDRSYEKQQDKKRILVLGDSFVWGYGVNAEETLTRRLEAELAGAEVINAGVTAYGTTQELLWLEREGVKYHPDLVVLVLYKNDILDNLTQGYNGYYRPIMVLKDDGSLQLTGVPCSQGSLKDKLRKWLVRYSALTGIALRSNFRFLLSFDRTIFGSAALEQGRENMASGSKHDDYPVRLTIALVEQARKVAQDHAARLLVVAVCHGDSSCTDVVQGLTSKGVSVLELDNLKGYSPADMIIPGDEHWNAAGHALAAKAITDFIKKNDLLP